MNTEKLLLISKINDSAIRGGRDLLCDLNYKMLNAVYGDRLYIYAPDEFVFTSNFEKILGYIDGLNKNSLSVISDIILQNHISTVFIDGSNFGKIAELIKKNSPSIKIITFFHNVEARFFWGSFKTVRNFRALAVFVANYLAERKAVRMSDKRICLSERDSRLLKKIYGQGSTHIAPMALEDKLPILIGKSSIGNHEPFALFVGGSFYANRDGIAWFVRHVVPSINIKICIVGKGMKNMRAQLNIPGRVEVIGPVDSLAQWYRDAYFVIAPIFDGSGMKTKVAEALMHGKKIIGTPEAFSGYEDVAERVGCICKTADEFVEAIASADKMVKASFDAELRTIYENSYSLPAARNRLMKILNE